MKTRSILFGFCSLIALIGCKKKQSTQEPINLALAPTPCVETVSPVTDPVMVQCKFKPGSFWVYKDEVTGSFDTLIVSSFSLRAGYTPPVFEGCEKVEIHVMSMIMKNESVQAFKEFRYSVSDGVVLLESSNLNHTNVIPMVFRKTNVFDQNCVIIDSMLINSQYYKTVCRSAPVEFIVNERFIDNNQVTYFNAEFGPLQFERHSRETGKFTSNKILIEKHLIR